MEAFFSAIGDMVNLTDSGKEALAGCLQYFQFTKGHVLVKQDTICNYVYFVERGLTRTFYLEDGRDITDWISSENSFAVSILSFLTRKPDRRIIELLEDSELWALSFDDLERLCRAHHDIEHLGRRLAESGIVQLQERFDALHFSNATTRYKNLLDTHPDYVNRVPLGMLASFLGITQETLSRVRKRYSV
jgi:CRP-like cAMP-binding protein